MLIDNIGNDDWFMTDLSGVKNVEILATTAGSSTLNATALAAGIDQIDLRGQSQFVDLTEFAGAITVNGTRTNDAIDIDLTVAGNKTLNLGLGQDNVEVSTEEGDAAGSVEVRFVSGTVGNGTNNNASIIGSGSTVTVNDEGTLISADGAASQSNVFKVQGINADGTVAANQNRGNFSYVFLGTDQEDFRSTQFFGDSESEGSQGNVYINAGAGNDELSAFAQVGQRHFLVGGLGDDSFSLSTVDSESATVASGTVVVLAGAGTDNVSVFNSSFGIESVDLGDGDDSINYTSKGLTLNKAGADQLNGGAGRDTLIARVGELLESKAPVAGAEYTISNFEEITVIGDSLINIGFPIGFPIGAFGGPVESGLVLANVQLGIDTVNLVQSRSTPVVFDVAAATVNLVGQDFFANTLDFSIAGSGTADQLTINNTAEVVDNDNNATTPSIGVDVFNGVSIDVTGDENLVGSVETLIINTTAAGALANGIALGFINSDDTVNFIGANNATAEEIFAAKVDASALQGGLTTTTAAGDVKGGLGSDVLTITATTNAAVAAVGMQAGIAAKNVAVSTSTGDDIVLVQTTLTQQIVTPLAGTVTIDTGAGDDLIVLTNGNAAVGTLAINAGEGDDEVVIGNRVLTAADAINGGAGTDDVAIIQAATSYTDDQFVVIRNRVTNFETLAFVDANNSELTVTIDASKLQQTFASLAFVETVDGVVTNTGTENIVAVNGSNLNVTAAGYIAGTSAGGNITVTALADSFTNGDTFAPFVLQSEIEVYGNNVTLNVVTENTSENRSGNNDSAALLAVDRLKGDATTATINLLSSVNTDVNSPTDTVLANNFAVVSINAEDNADLLANLTSLDINGNGFAFIENEGASLPNNPAGSKLATIDASGLNSILLADYAIDNNDFALLFGDSAFEIAAIYGVELLEAGDKSFGLIYSSDNAGVKETVTLSGGVDIIQSSFGSTFDKMDSIIGLNLEVVAGDDDESLNDDYLSNQSDMISVNRGQNFFEKLTAEQKAAIDSAAGNSLELYLTEVAKLSVDSVVFQFGNNSYIFQDLGEESSNDLLDDIDTVVELVGVSNVDSVLVSLNNPAQIFG